jgi:hypothetical protein
MRELLTSLLLTSCLLPIAAGGMQLSSDFAQPVASHKFAALEAEPLWPSEVRRIDPTLQAYERIPAAVSANTMVADAKPAGRVKLVLGADKPAVASEEVPLLAELQSAEAQEWCGARYRSYDPADNTYQPYGGGPRRNCAAPVETPTSPIQQVADVNGMREPDANARWCMERYSSYRVEDNTYQPFSGGRKQCPGPGFQSVSNAFRTTGNATVTQF